MWCQTAIEGRHERHSVLKPAGLTKYILHRALHVETVDDSLQQVTL